MLDNKETLVFAGPSLSDELTSLIEKSENLKLCPPIKRGDLPEILQQGFIGNLVIVDGLFGQSLAVGHAEIRQAIQKGCKVYGLSSMGAIRAYEMRHMGVIGYGKVYERFAKDDLEDFQDDEVTLLHTPAPECMPLSEPLIHFRVCIDDLVNNKVLTAAQGANIITKLKSLYFGDRTMYLFKNLIKDEANLKFEDIVPDFDQYRIKTSDLKNFLLEFVSKTY